MPRKKVDEVQPGTVPLEDEPKATPKAGGKKIGNKAKGGRQRKEEEPRSHHKRPGPSVDQVKGGIAVVGGLVQSLALAVTQNKETGRSPVERVALTEEEMARAANVVGDQIVRFTPVARALTYVDAARKSSPVARELAAIAAPRLARLGLMPPALARMIGVPEEDIRAGIEYRAEQIAREKMRRQAPPMTVPRDRTAAGPRPDERDRVVETSARVPPTGDRNTNGEGIPSVGVPPEAYEPVRATHVEPSSRRSGGGMDSLTEPPR